MSDEEKKYWDREVDLLERMHHGHIVRYEDQLRECWSDVRYHVGADIYIIGIKAALGVSTFFGEYCRHHFFPTK